MIGRDCQRCLGNDTTLSLFWFSDKNVYIGGSVFFSARNTLVEVNYIGIGSSSIVFSIHDWSLIQNYIHFLASNSPNCLVRKMRDISTQKVSVVGSNGDCDHAIVTLFDNKLLVGECVCSFDRFTEF